jgi:hypothetical protein
MTSNVCRRCDHVTAHRDAHGRCRRCARAPLSWGERTAVGVTVVLWIALGAMLAAEIGR